jgi:ABC-type phosphate transport system substrate-binding protein
MTRFAVTLLVTAGGMLAARAASAQDAGTTPTCASLPNPVYLDGSSAFEPTVAAFAVKMAAETPPTTVVYLKPGSCSGVNIIATNADITGSGTYYTLTGTTLNKPTCTLPASGQKADIGVSDVFYGSCGAAAPATQPPTLKDFPGPVQAMEFVVAKSNTSTQYLTAAEAQDLYGCGATAGISSFSSASNIFCRDQNSGTQIIITSNIGLSPMIPVTTTTAAGICVSESGSGPLATAVAGATPPTAGVGFLGADVYDTDRTTLNALAFEAVGQTKAFYADSTPTAVDRQNVRDGHYPMWGYEHMFAYVDTTGKPTSANAAELINLITGDASDANVGDAVALEGKAGTIPLCAMSVAKTNDSPGYLSPTAAPTCTCAYVKAASGTAPAGCTPCGGGSDGGADAAAGGCSGGKTCSHGYCE